MSRAGGGAREDNIAKQEGMARVASAIKEPWLRWGGQPFFLYWVWAVCTSDSVPHCRKYWRKHVWRSLASPSISDSYRKFEDRGETGRGSLERG